MKMTKKWLLAAAVLALVFNFASCKSEEDDDDEISGSKIEVVNTEREVKIGGTKYTYTVEYDTTARKYYAKDSDGVYLMTDADGNYTRATTGTKVEISTKRVYSSTRLKHLGALMRIELRDQTNQSLNGVAGVMWDLKKSSDRTSYDDVADTVGELTGDSEVLDDAIDFFILGFRNNKGTLQYYISKFFNVTTVNDNNFGAHDDTTDSDVTTTTHALAVTQYTTPVEIPVKNAFTDIGTADIDEDDTIYVWADIYPAYTTGKILGGRKSYGLKYADYTEADAGEFVVDIYVGADKPTAETTKTSEGTKLVETIVIGKDITGYTDARMPQAKAARYGNAYAGCDFNGYVKYQKKYAEDETVEE